MIFLLLVLFLLFVKCVWPTIESRQNIARYLEDIFCLPPSELEEAVKDSEEASASESDNKSSGEDGDTEKESESEIENESENIEQPENTSDDSSKVENELQGEVEQKSDQEPVGQLIENIENIENVDDSIETRDVVKEVVTELANQVSEDILEKKNN
jgi:hypothetical protein